MKHTKKLILTGCAGLLLAASTQAAVWQGTAGDGLWETAGNWDDGLAPNGTISINNGDTVTRGVDSAVDRTFVENGSTLLITGGIHGDNRSGSTIRNFVGNNSAGTVIQTGGAYSIGHSLVVGNGVSGDGTYNLSGGILTLYRGANSVIDTSFGRGSLDLGSSSATSGDFNITGGTLETRFGGIIGQNGTFHVAQSGLSVGFGVTNADEGWWIQKAGGVLRTGVDSGGATNIIVQDTQLGEGVLFDIGAILDPYDAGGTALNTWFTVMTESGDGSIVDNGLTLSSAAATAGWEHRIQGDTVQVRLVPEPSSTALLGLGGLALILRRRK